MRSSSPFASAGTLALNATDGSDLPSVSSFPSSDAANSAAANSEDQDEGDLAPGIDEDALNQDELDTDQIATCDA